MRSRLVILLACLLAVTALLPATAFAAEDAMVLAQDTTGPEEQAQGQEGQGGEGQGQGSSEAETGSGGAAEEGSTETGPPWTYQMARLSVALLVLLALSMGLVYYRLVTKRQRGEA